jgi:hypothetical protein
LHFDPSREPPFFGGFAMSASPHRRDFIRTAAAGSIAGLGDLAFLSRLRPVTAEESRLDPKLVRLDSNIEPLVRLIEDTPREKLIEEVGSRVQHGLSYRELLAALLLAGVRNIQPRPVGFKFHAVLVVNSAHLASLESPEQYRWLPIFWALDNFKSSQAKNQQEGGWRMGPVDESKIPPAHKARQAFEQAMDSWDEQAADAAVAGFARTASMNEAFDVFARFGCRDFRDIGHKAIYVANAFRTMQAIGWQYAEPILRSLAYALLQHEGDSPAKRDGAPDRSGRQNLTRAGEIKDTWQDGKPDAAATAAVLSSLRQGSDSDACGQVVELLNKGVAPQSIWDALHLGACELLMRQPGIVGLHTVTSANALHYAYQTCGQDATRKLLLLQCAAFLPQFRASMRNLPKEPAIDKLEPVAAEREASPDWVFADVGKNRMAGAQKALGYLKAGGDARSLFNAARLLIFMKGTDAHDYKFSSAVLEDYYHASPEVRDRFIAASTYWLKGTTAKDNSLVERIREALKT